MPNIIDTLETDIRAMIAYQTIHFRLQIVIYCCTHASLVQRNEINRKIEKKYIFELAEMVAVQVISNTKNTQNSKVIIL